MNPIHADQMPDVEPKTSAQRTCTPKLSLSSNSFNSGEQQKKNAFFGAFAIPTASALQLKIYLPRGIFLGHPCGVRIRLKSDSDIDDSIKVQAATDGTRAWTSSALPFGLLLGLLLFPLILHATAKFTSVSVQVTDPSQCTFVSGGGFGAFWYNWGRLQSITSLSSKERDNDANKEFYCSSSGCYVVVAYLSADNLGSLIDLHEKENTKIETGNATIPEAVDSVTARAVLPCRRMGRKQCKKRILDKLNILTTTWGVGLHAQKATSAEELHELLRQTSWLPYITGAGLAAQDANGKFHVDGDVLGKLFAPNCDHVIGLPYWKLDVLRHIVTPVPRDMMWSLWKAGREYGLYRS